MELGSGIALLQGPKTLRDLFDAEWVADKAPWTDGGIA
jgi:hypothetical protein